MRRGILCWIMFCLCMGFAFGGQTVRYWYHVDNPDSDPLPDLVHEFHRLHPDITICAESIPWGSYYENLQTAIIGGTPPDAAMVKLLAAAWLVERDALEPLDMYIANWHGKNDIIDNLWDKMRSNDTKTYLLPLQYVVSYLYIRQDLFDKHSVAIPTTMEEFLAAAQSLTLDEDKDGEPEVYGFGFRGGRAGHEHWGVFVLPNARDITPEQMRDPWVERANQFVIDLYRTHNVMPPSAPYDGFDEIAASFRTGRTAMTIHHIGSSARVVEALGDRVSAVPVPRCGKNGEGWTNFGDEENAIFAKSENKDAAWQWISFLSTAEYNARLVTATGQLPVTKSASVTWDKHEKRFLDATIASLPFAYTLPLLPQTEEFVNAVWPRKMERALLGRIDSATMLREIDKHFNE